MQDLYQIFQQRLAARITSLHPHRWLIRAFGCGPSVIDCKLQCRPLFGLKEFADAPVALVGGIAVTVGRNGPPIAQNGHQALRAIGRQSKYGVYLAHPRLAWDYATHRPFVVQDAFKDFLKERIPCLQLEVRSAAGVADAVTPRSILEVARIISWKQGLGQLLVYALDFPDRRRILYLFGPSAHPKQLQHVRSLCHQFACHVAYTRCDERSFGPQTTRRFLAPSRPPEIHGCGGNPEECVSMQLRSEAHRSGYFTSPEILDGIDLSGIEPDSSGRLLDI